jgi:hypothetical protein
LPAWRPPNTTLHSHPIIFATSRRTSHQYFFTSRRIVRWQPLQMGDTAISTGHDGVHALEHLVSRLLCRYTSRMHTRVNLQNKHHRSAPLKAPHLRPLSYPDTNRLISKHMATLISPKEQSDIGPWSMLPRLRAALNCAVPSTTLLSDGTFDPPPHVLSVGDLAFTWY